MLAKTPERSPRKHLDFLDGVRGLAAVYVVLHHAILTVPEPDQSSALEWMIRRAGGLGHYSVDVFIVLSGYCLMLPQLKSDKLDVLQFLKRRALRILPSYYAAGAIALVLIHTLIGTPSGSHWDLTFPVTRRDLVTHLLLIHDWFPDSAAKINHVFWSIGVEWKIYFLFPLLLLLRRRIGAAPMAFFAMLASYALWSVCAAFGILNPGPWGSSFYYIGLFAMGMLAADWAEQGKLPKWLHSRAQIVAAVSSLTVAMLAMASFSHNRIPLQLQSGLVGLWTVTLLIALRSESLPQMARFPFINSASLWLGRQAYSLYLIHAPLLHIVYWYWIRHVESSMWRLLLMITFGMAATLLMLPVFFALAERPFHQLSRRVKARPVRRYDNDASKEVILGKTELEGRAAL
ncbi:MAG TPA: acyltransferase [Polyangiaceae bacterium]